MSKRTQLVAKYDRGHRFIVNRELGPRGLYRYQLHNAATKQSLMVPLDLFDRFRSILRDSHQEIQSDGVDRVERELRFGGRTRFTWSWRRASPSAPPTRNSTFHVQSFGFDGLPNYRLEMALEALPSLVGLLYDPRLGHPDDLLLRIVTYHRLFAATFAEATESITSGLRLRKGLLFRMADYVPMLSPKRTEPLESGEVEPAMLEILAPDVPVARSTPNFRSRLGERDQSRDYRVDYEALFDRNADQGKRGTRSRAGESQSGVESDGDGSLDHFALPLAAAEVKRFDRIPLRAELTLSDLKSLRLSFLNEVDTSVYLGFEILDCVFEVRGRLKTFRFPLYYLPVRIVESGRELVLYPVEGGRFYLNHFGLAQLIEERSPDAQVAKRLEDFLFSVLSQRFSVRGEPDRIRVLRWLPCHPEVFDETREVLLGRPGEHGKGGLLSEVNVSAIECDLEGVEMYRSPEEASPIERALNEELRVMLDRAEERTAAFETSLLSRSLNAARRATESERVFADNLSMPGAQPRAIRSLLDRLNQHDLVLLEGPPGTGKTYNIANLVIHCVATGKRLLVVSDQQAAIQALAEQLQGYVVDKDRDTPLGRELDRLWRMGIKVMEELPEPSSSMSQWARQIRRMLGLDAAQELDWPEPVSRYELRLRGLDEEMAQIEREIGQHMETAVGRVAPKVAHPATPAQVDAEVETFKRLQGSDEAIGGLSLSIHLRERLVELGLADAAYHLFGFDSPEDLARQRLGAVWQWLRELKETAPTSVEGFDSVSMASSAQPLHNALRKRWEKEFPADPTWTSRVTRLVKNLSQSKELHHTVEELEEMVVFQLELLGKKGELDPSVWESLTRLHATLAPSGREPPDVPLELAFAQAAGESSKSVHEKLEALDKVQQERDDLVRRQFMFRLGEIARRALSAGKGRSTNRLTSILATLDRLEAAPYSSRVSEVVADLQDLLYETFPVWICRKQAVPFILPGREESFHLVVVDEATQCRVDDALPLLYRGRKLLAVGDERQTVLAKNSAIDDYLFEDFELDDHLRVAQARGMKGGGSHLFGLVERIKQASVMLEEHYRCPPDIIEFSNRYVYEDQLRSMQWKMRGSPPSLFVDHSEARTESSTRETSGRFKGIETEMIDRFFAFVARAIRRIERETGKPVNPETDVALVYFLMKNEAYIKAAKSDLLARLPRGSDVLDGAGAALQGKERDFVFYLWDITRYNIGVFRQGDDEAKRKGELNVLMSRPKKRAYHFLHRDFDTLKHQSTSITDYLWRARQRGATKSKASPRGSGLLIRRLLEDAMGDRTFDDDELQFGVVAGNPLFAVDLVWLPAPEHRDDHRGPPAVAVVDLAWFLAAKNPGREVIDYYFQLQRARPSIRPVFGFLHEFVRPGSGPVRRLRSLSPYSHES